MIKNRSDLIVFNPRRQSGFGLVQIHSDCCLGLGQIHFLPFFIKRNTKRFSEWFGMIRIGSDTDIGMNRNSSDWLGIIPIRYFRQGILKSVSNLIRCKSVENQTESIRFDPRLKIK